MADETYDLSDDPEPEATPPPKKAGPPAPPPLPRIRYAEPEPAASTAPPAKKPRDEPPRKAEAAPPPKGPKSRPKPEATPAVGEDGEKKRLIEDTPELDTADTRGRLRIVFGATAVGLVLLAGYVIFRAAAGQAGPDPEDVADDPVVAPTPTAAPPSRLEVEARVVLADARAFARRGDADNTMKRLRKVVEDYPKSASAKEATEAIRRAEEGLPVFPDGTLVLARSEVTAPPPEPPKVEINATTPQTTLPAGPSVVEVQPPPTPPEPYRDVMLPFERAVVAAKPLPPGFRPRVEAGLHPSGWPWEITCDQDGAPMRLIPGGAFQMGRDDGPLLERPAHRVALGTYYMDQHEVTARQLALYRAKHPAPGKPAGADPSASGSEDGPAVQVSWRDASAYLAWAGKKMPTEAQWEMAARTIDGRMYPWGAGLPSWQRPRRPGQIEPVGSHPLDMSPYGVFDLAGNATEWTSDLFDPRYYTQLPKDAVTADPTGPAKVRSKIPFHVVKGGSKTWETSWRDGASPDSRMPTLGFRGVLPVEAAPAQAAPAPGTTVNGTPAGNGPAPPTNGFIPF